MFYSASNNGFYTVDIHGGNMPSDVVEIGDDNHQELIHAQTQGKQIVPGADGYPMLIDPVVVVVDKEADIDPVEKLRAFLAANPDVSALL